jgi:diketogulonate reductase-like aldo/keto reductase
MYSKTFTLNTGAEIPAIGLGTWRSGKGEVEKVQDKCGSEVYRRLGCSLRY